jgi:hypothetical protein
MGANKQAAYLDAPVWRHSSVLREDAFAFFDTPRVIALLVKFLEFEERLVMTGDSSHLVCCNAVPECFECLEEHR